MVHLKYHPRSIKHIYRKMVPNRIVNIGMLFQTKQITTENKLNIIVKVVYILLRFA